MHVLVYHHHHLAVFRVNVTRTDPMCVFLPTCVHIDFCMELQLNEFISIRLHFALHPVSALLESKSRKGREGKGLITRPSGEGSVTLYRVRTQRILHHFWAFLLLFLNVFNPGRVNARFNNLTGRLGSVDWPGGTKPFLLLHWPSLNVAGRR